MQKKHAEEKRIDLDQPCDDQAEIGDLPDDRIRMLVEQKKEQKKDEGKINGVAPHDRIDKGRRKDDDRRYFQGRFKVQPVFADDDGDDGRRAQNEEKDQRHPELRMQNDLCRKLIRRQMYAVVLCENVFADQGKGIKNGNCQGGIGGAADDVWTVGQRDIENRNEIGKNTEKPVKIMASA